MCKYYGYIRVSTETQVESGYGLEDQRKAVKAYAAQKGYTLEKIFADEGISGLVKDEDLEKSDAISKRKSLIEMLATLEAGDTVIVLNLARLWRSDSAKAIIRSRLKICKARIESIEEPRFDLYEKNPSNRLLDTMMEALAEYDRTCIAVKLARGRTTKARTGAKPAGVCPFGYQYAADKKSVVINPAEADAVHYMYTEAQKGKSLSQIAAGLTGKGIMTRQGKQWSKGSIANVLKNKFYTGILMHAGDEIKGTHEAIISKIQFGKVQAQLEKRHR